MNRKWLHAQLKTYTTPFIEEQEFVRRFTDLLFIENCFSRSLLSGHITASAWVLTADHKHVALMHHKKLDKWLQPGGHSDGDENVAKVARKELSEEMGIIDVEPLEDSIFDLDIHRIPARKEVEAHEHFDVRFAFIANSSDQLKKNHESNKVAWVPLDDLEAYVGNETSILRMKEKTSLL